MAHRQSDSELIGQLCEQVRFLRRSAAAYDAGDDAEAKRLALIARLLCHDAGGSHALLAQLKLLGCLQFVDTADEDLPSSPRSQNEEPELVWETVFMSSLAPVAGGPRGYVAQLDRAHVSAPKPFFAWWQKSVLRDSRKNDFTRKDIVLALANKDGGAHVDPTIESSYAAISRQSSLGTISYTTARGERLTAEANPTLATMRQIAFELERTLAPVVGNS